MAYQNQISFSNSTSNTVIISAPAASTSRTIPAGGINVANPDASNSASFTLVCNVAGTESILEPIVLVDSTQSWSNDKNIYSLDATNETIEIRATASLAESLNIFTTYRDEVQ